MPFTTISAATFHSCGSREPRRGTCSSAACSTSCSSTPSCSAGESALKNAGLTKMSRPSVAAVGTRALISTRANSASVAKKVLRSHTRRSAALTMRAVLGSSGMRPLSAQQALDIGDLLLQLGWHGCLALVAGEQSLHVVDPLLQQRVARYQLRKLAHLVLGAHLAEQVGRAQLYPFRRGVGGQPAESVVGRLRIVRPRGQPNCSGVADGWLTGEGNVIAFASQHALQIREVAV